jgi:hypothetical protein
MPEMQTINLLINYERTKQESTQMEIEEKM